MSSASNFLYYGTPIHELSKYYPQIKPPFPHSQTITTQLPRNVVIIRCCAAIALTAFLATVLLLNTGSIIWCWPVALAGVAYTGWTIYSHILRKDPLVEAFYKIVGGKKEFNKLPKIKLSNTSLSR